MKINAINSSNFENVWWDDDKMKIIVEHRKNWAKFRTHTLIHTNWESNERKRKKSIKTCSYRFDFFRYAFSVWERNDGWIRMRERACRCVRAYECGWKREARKEKRLLNLFSRHCFARCFSWQNEHTLVQPNECVCVYTHRASNMNSKSRREHASYWIFALNSNIGVIINHHHRHIADRFFEVFRHHLIDEIFN